MTLKLFLALSSVVLTAGTAPAQTPEPAADRLSGLWSGYMGPDQGTRMPVSVTFKLAGRSVTGTITGPPNPGTIKSGTFDPASGALTLTVHVEGDGSEVRFEGTVRNDSASGKVLFGAETGYFRLARSGSGPSRLTQASKADEGLAAARRGFTEVSGWVTRAAELVPAERYGYRPVQTVRTFGQLLAHVVDGYTYYCARAAGRQVQWTDAVEKGATDKATVVSRLKQATDACNEAYAAGTVGPLFENVSHTSLHYGNMITYIRVMGLVPPSS